MATHKRERHGDTGTRLYSIWHDMRYRCKSTTCKSAKWYADNSITVCTEWDNSYLCFKNWALSNGYNPVLTLDRKDNNKGYYPDNCRFSSWNVQRRNTRVLNSRNTSGYRGVFWNSQKTKWQVRIVINNKPKHLGFFVDKLDAAKAYDQYVITNKLEHTINNV